MNNVYYNKQEGKIKLKKGLINMKQYAVGYNGIVMGQFDTRMNDGCRWGVNYQGEPSGVLQKDSTKLAEFDTLEEAVAFSRQVRTDVLKKQYDDQLSQILTGDWKGY